jgi:uncharacterized membrane protein YbhN (UPF0104 family)
VTQSPLPAEPAPIRRPKSRRRTVIQGLVTMAVVAAIAAFALPQVVDLSEVWDLVRGMTGVELAVLGLATLCNLLSYVAVSLIATPGATYGQALVLTESTTAVANTVPAGGAVAVGLTYAMLTSWGFSRSRATFSVVVSGIWDNFAKLGMPIVALAILALMGGARDGRTAVALVALGGLAGAVVVFVLILRSESFAARTGVVVAGWVSWFRHFLKRGPVIGWDIALVNFRARVVDLVHRRWLALTVATLVQHLSLYSVLLISLRQIGVSDDEVGWAEVLAVLSFGRLLTAIPITPGGIGVIELALIAGLSGAGGDHAQVVGAVLVFRVLTFVLPIPIGFVTYVFWRRNRSWLGSAPPLQPRRRRDRALEH